MSRLLLAAPILLVVDRIEPPVAVLEWPSGALIDAPLDVLPAELSEGDILRLRRTHSPLGGGEERKSGGEEGPAVPKQVGFPTTFL